MIIMIIGVKSVGYRFKNLSSFYFHKMSDTVFRSRSLGVSTEGVPDQYADGVAAKVWEIYIGDQQDRTIHYKSFLTKLLRDNNCMHILDVACGTGIDSIMLLEEGFKIMSVDASDRMLKYALKKRWNRRKEPAFDEWGESVTCNTVAVVTTAVLLYYVFLVSLFNKIAFFPISNPASHAL
ncbi:GNMT [Cordylochernes scorpioides]|uniref:Glycine N-methyltransferase n=1 Tax=Cordylochernes scorpioides TaxID=51811 RepID=A0ABY6KJH0_9ARAC|nr:GNMT [Cordylochernes scorpioides]